MVWVYGLYNYVNSFSAEDVFMRQNLTSRDVRFWRMKTAPALKGLNQHLYINVSCFLVAYSLETVRWDYVMATSEIISLCSYTNSHIDLYIWSGAICGILDHKDIYICPCCVSICWCWRSFGSELDRCLVLKMNYFYPSLLYYYY